MKGQPRQHRMDGLLALRLFAVFAACILAVLLSGAGAYRRLVDRDQGAYDSRTCIQYIATRVRQSDIAGSVEVVSFQGTNALALEESTGYVTRVYWYDGYLMELYAAADSDLAPEDGVKLLESEPVDFSLEDGLLTVKIDGGSAGKVLCLSLRTEEGRTVPA